MSLFSYISTCILISCDKVVIRDILIVISESCICFQIVHNVYFEQLLFQNNIKCEKYLSLLILDACKCSRIQTLNKLILHLITS